jgi:outer membrane protein OmpA-like peptidoglycan-associated protein
MKPAFRSRANPARPLLRAIAIGWAAVLSFHGCAPARDAGIAGRAGDSRSISEGFARELAAIDGATATRTADGVRVTLDADTLFGTDSAMLRLESERTIERLAGVLLRYPANSIVVAAHTDSIGRGNYKTMLTERQALSIGELLVDMGVPPSRVETRGLGDLQPAASNATPEGRRANRRVTIDILPGAAPGKR